MHETLTGWRHVAYKVQNELTTTFINYAIRGTLLLVLVRGGGPDNSTDTETGIWTNLLIPGIQQLLLSRLYTQQGAASASLLSSATTSSSDRSRFRHLLNADISSVCLKVVIESSVLAVDMFGDRNE
jgi:hypothetical protein